MFAYYMCFDITNTRYSLILVHNFYTAGSKNIIYAVTRSVVITATVTVIFMLVIVAIVLIIRKYHQSKRQYNFQHLPFDGNNDTTEKMITTDYETVKESLIN